MAGVSAATVVRMLAICKYRYQDQSKKHIMAAISSYRNLDPKQEMFTFQNGISQELVVLTGTIPVNYRGVTYNIPVALYIPQDYPYSPPICYVRPTADMMVKPSRHVDTSGRVYLPYLTDWKNDASDMHALIQVMIFVFSETPPVYQKPKNNQPFAQQQPAVDNSPYPRQPGVAIYGPMTNNVAPYPQQQTNESYRTVAGFPPRPATNPGYPTPTSGYPQYPAYPGYPNAAGGTFPQPPQPSTTSAGTTPYPAYPSYPSSTYPAASGASTTPTSTPYPTGTVTAEHLKASLMSAVEDRIRTRLREKISQKEAEIKVLENTKQELDKGTRVIDSIISNCEKEAAELLDAKSNMEKLDSHYQSLILKYNDSNEAPDIDEAFGPTEPLYKQLLNAFAEENAISDAIYELQRGLEKGVVDLDTFLKNVRDLSRKQFMLRALMQKCRERAGLPY